MELVLGLGKGQKRSLGLVLDGEKWQNVSSFGKRGNRFLGVSLSFGKRAKRFLVFIFKLSFRFGKRAKRFHGASFRFWKSYKTEIKIITNRRALNNPRIKHLVRILAGQ